MVAAATKFLHSIYLFKLAPRNRSMIATFSALCVCVCVCVCVCFVFASFFCFFVFFLLPLPTLDEATATANDGCATSLVVPVVGFLGYLVWNTVYLVLPSFSGFYRWLPSFTGFYLVFFRFT